MKIHAIPYNVFNDIMSERNITDNNISEWKNQAFIEIQGEDDEKTEECKFWFKQDHPNVLRLHFDDVEEDIWPEDLQGNRIGYQCKVITDEQAKILYDFIEQNKGKHFLIHCHAGVSRSGAVAQFVCEMNNISLSEFEIMNPYAYPNRKVLEKLRKLQP